MKYRLVHLSGSLAGVVREIDAPEVVLGRDPAAAQIVFEDRLVSRRHAVLSDEGGALVLRDLESRSGTFLAGEDVEEAELEDGDVFELGKGGPRVRVELSEGGTLFVQAPRPVAPGGPSPSARSPAAPLGPGSKLHLSFQSGARRGDKLDLAGAVLRMGRARGSNVWTPEDRMVSAQHAKVVRLEDGYVLMDLESTNGTFLNGHRVERAPVNDGDTIRLGVDGPEIDVRILAPTGTAAVPATVVIPNFAELVARSLPPVVAVRDLVLEGTLVVGRGEGVDLRLDSPIVSRSHARLSAAPEGPLLEDLGSANGTFVNGRRVQTQRLSAGDQVVVGPFQIEVALPLLRVWDTRNRTRVDARSLTVSAGGKPILAGVSLSLPPGSFTALIGPSGAGKSTLLSALSGARPADEGEVRLNGVDLYQAFEHLKATLGYVPQDDIVHGELTIEESLLYTARLRLPRSLSRGEREARVAQVLATLELTERRHTEVRRLSGGQRKRVSIAVELLTEPHLLFLDEPTSGLDPGLEEALMLLLRELSYKGKTVVLVTHTLDNIGLCDAVVLLVDGRSAFYGPADEARAHFGIDHIVNLYARLKERPPREWQAHFEATEGFARRVTQPLAEVPAVRVGAARPLAGTIPSRPGPLHQLAVLTSRYFKTLTRDSRNAALLLGQAPLIAGLIGLSLLYGPSEIAYTKPKNTLLFLLGLTAVWFGCSNAAREIVKERSIYLRERMVNLRVIPYVLSKVLVLAAIALAQCLMLYGILERWFGIPGRPSLVVASMALAATVGILLGLTLSALVASADRAMTLLPIVLIPQVLFTVPAVQMDMKGPAGFVARAMPTWWAFDLLRRVALEPVEQLDDDQVEARLRAGGPVLMTKRRLEDMLQEGYMMFNYRGAMETTWTAAFPERLAQKVPASLGRWRPAVVDVLALLGFATLFQTATVILQRRQGR